MLERGTSKSFAIRQIDMGLDVFCRFWYSAIACSSLASFSMLSGSLGRVRVVVGEN